MGYLGVQLFLVGLAALDGGVFGGVAPLGAADGAAETVPLFGGCYGDGAPVVLAPAGIYAVGGGFGIAVGAAAGQAAVDLVVEDGGAGGYGAGLENRGFHGGGLAGPLAAHQGADDGGGLEYAGMVVGIGGVDGGGRFAFIAGHKGYAAHVLHQYAVGFIGVVRADAAQPGLPHQDDVGAELAQLGEVDAPAVEDVAAEVGHKDVADFHQFAEHFEAAGGADVNGYALFHPLEIGLAGAPGPGGDKGHFVQHFVGFDFDDFGAERGEDAAGEGEGYIRPQFDDAQTGQGFAGHIRPLISLRLAYI